MLRRITPEEVVEAYKKLDMKPVYGVWIEHDSSNQLCGCAITAISMATKEISAGDFTNGVSDDETEYVSSLLELDLHYVDGFIQGFDGTSKRGDLPLYCAGYDDGVNTRLLVAEEFGIL